MESVQHRYEPTCIQWRSAVSSNFPLDTVHWLVLLSSLKCSTILRKLNLIHPDVASQVNRRVKDRTRSVIHRSHRRSQYRGPILKSCIVQNFRITKNKFHLLDLRKDGWCGPRNHLHFSSIIQCDPKKATFHAIRNSNQSLWRKCAENFTASRKHIDTSLVKIWCVMVRRFTSYRQSKLKEIFPGKNGNPLSQNGSLSGTGYPFSTKS